MCKGGMTAATAALLLVAATSAGQAQQRLAGSESQCAIYGAGYVAVQGSSTCVRIGGRVRLEMNTGTVGHAYAPGGLSSGQFGGAAAPDGANRAHLRLGGSPGRNAR